MASKPLVWMGDSLERVRAFSAAVRQRIGFELWEIQQGEPPSDSKPMSSIGPGVRELRVRSAGAYRVIYLAAIREAVFVLHAFEKKSPKTGRVDIELARIRFKELMQEKRRNERKAQADS